VSAAIILQTYLQKISWYCPSTPTACPC
jgi:hypothetical protein